MPKDLMEINEMPSIHWEKFFTKFSEIDNLPVKDWKAVHILAYFSKKYKDHYKVKFSFRFNSTSPTKSYEVFQIRKLGQIISSNPEILKDYIDWFFENKIILKKKRITSLAFLVDVNVANEFKFKYLVPNLENSIDRNKSLPVNILALADELGVECKTYGDLAFLSKAEHKSYFINKIIELGFDINLLSKVK